MQRYDLDRQIALREEQLGRTHVFCRDAKEGGKRRAFVIPVEAPCGNDESASAEAEIGDFADMTIRLPKNVFADDTAIRGAELDVSRNIAWAQKQQLCCTVVRTVRESSSVVFRHADTGSTQTCDGIGEQRSFRDRDDEAHAC